MPRRRSEKSPSRRWGRSRSRGRRNSSGYDGQQEESYAAEASNDNMMLASTVTGATGQTGYTYATATNSPPPSPTKKSLTGNISSLFRRGKSEKDLKSASSNASSTYAPPQPPPKSPNNNSQVVKETIDSQGATTLLGRTTSNNSGLMQPTRSTSGQHKHRLFYSNADDEDSQDSFENRTRSGLSDSAKQSSAATPSRHAYGRYHTASPSTVQNYSTMGSTTEAGDTYDTST
ncbi:MAG: hypothetical protein SGILL_006268, partial [Bacillariaceae sp.]